MRSAPSLRYAELLVIAGGSEEVVFTCEVAVDPLLGRSVTTLCRLDYSLTTQRNLGPDPVTQALRPGCDLCTTSR